MFINMDPAAKLLEHYLGVMVEHYERWDMAERFVEVHIEKELYANWKAAKEAFTW